MRTGLQGGEQHRGGELPGEDTTLGQAAGRIEGLDPRPMEGPEAAHHTRACRACRACYTSALQVAGSGQCPEAKKASASARASPTALGLPAQTYGTARARSCSPDGRCTRASVELLVD